MQDVEHAVGKNERPRKRRQPARELARIDDLAFKGRGLHAAGLPDGCAARHTLSLPTWQYSNTLTTRRTPSVVRTISAAAFPSVSVTIPMRNATPASVTTLMCSELKFLPPSKRALTFEVTSESPVRALIDETGPTTRSFTT